MKKYLLFVMTLMGLLSLSLQSMAQTPPLASASTFAVFTATGAINNTGSTLVTGDIGTNAGAYNGFPPGIVIGGVYNENAVSALAASDVQIAYGSFAGIPCDVTISTTLGSGQILTPNTYCLGAASSLTGNLILDAQGDPDAIFIFKINGAFSTAVLSNIVLENLAMKCNIYWQVGGQFTLGDNSVFYGTVINDGAVSILNNAYLGGRILSVAGAVNLNSNVIENVCSSALPMDLVSFAADCKQNKAYLTWTTGNEANNDYFSVERSGDAHKWEEIGQIDGSGNSSKMLDYTFTDQNSSTYAPYYRFRQVDFDGSFNYSSVLELKNCGNKETSVEVFPNPSRGKLYISYNDAADKFISATLYNAVGAVIYRSTTQEAMIDVATERNGIYILHIQMASGLIVKRIL